MVSPAVFQKAKEPAPRAAIERLLVKVQLGPISETFPEILRKFRIEILHQQVFGIVLERGGARAVLIDGGGFAEACL